MSHVKVIMPVGQYTAPRCHIDEFFPGELTISTDDEHNYIMRVFREDEWLSATGYDSHGNPVSFISRTAQDRIDAILAAANRKVA
jgi:hypothetical protein